MEETKTYSSCWKTRLNQELKRTPAKNNSGLRIAILGVGNEVRGDDAAGIQVVRRLSKKAANSAQVLVIDCGPAPENFSGQLRRFEPDAVIYIDAAELGEAPGMVQLVPTESLAAVAPSTHTLSPAMLFDYLTTELHCRCLMLAIQVGDARLDQSISPQVSAVIAEISDGLAELLSSLPGAKVT